MHTKIRLCLLLILFCVYIMGCDKANSVTNSDVSTVKSATLEIDKSLTVGQAVDKYKYFSKVRWEAKKTENGKRLVCAYGDAPPESLPSQIKSAEFQLQFVINTDKSIDLFRCEAAVEKKDGTKFGANEAMPAANCLKAMKSIYDNNMIR